MKKIVLGILLCAFGSVSICAQVTDDEIGGVSRGYNAPEVSGADDSNAKRLAEEARIAAEKAAKAAEDARVAAEAAARAAERARMSTGSNATTAAEKKTKEDKARALAAGAFGKGGTSSGSGLGRGSIGSTPGNPLGKSGGTSNGQSWSLSGRDLVGSIPKPAYVGNQEGVIIIIMTVDKNGNVIDTDIGKGTTISDEALRNECKASARRAKFSANPKAVGNQIGSITYRFKEK